MTGGALNLLPAPKFVADDVLFAGRTGKFKFGHNVQAFDSPAGGSFKGWHQVQSNLKLPRCGSQGNASRKSQTPNPKTQTNPKTQCPKDEFLGFGALDLFGIWDLGFGVWRLGFGLYLVTR